MLSSMYHNLKWKFIILLQALPRTFSDNLKKKLPENVTLKGPSGVEWNVGLQTRDNTVYFVDGWHQFARDHSLKENDFAVFKYNGESLFNVLIFQGESFCEKAASYFVGLREKETNKSVEEVNTVLNAGVESASPEQFTANAVTIVLPSQSTGKRTKQPVNEVTPVQTKKRGRPPKKANCSLEREVHDYDLVACNKEHSEASISGKEDEKKIAHLFTSSFPYFVMIMKSCNISGSRTLRIPCHFSATHLPDCKTEVTLRNARGECWNVNSIPVGATHTFCGGWMAFVRDNGINLGDTIIFELVSNFVMKVYISGVGKEGLDYQNYKRAQKCACL
ncbi:putative transcription factor B3-Domain family [Medicago truncatula]|uniref:Putative transcription factor B3-Domain family n=1 Tax=Medicago truncatula TaxID=3880 RepID=A0A396JM34_MEDTR|nr:putative transcription factor B3-Domain family [Medicago truncatula]